MTTKEQWVLDAEARCQREQWLETYRRALKGGQTAYHACLAADHAHGKRQPDPGLQP
jgi:hypothetical protein